MERMNPSLKGTMNPVSRESDMFLLRRVRKKDVKGFKSAWLPKTGTTVHAYLIECDMGVFEAEVELCDVRCR
jgi:hypothetical protein